MLRWWPTRSVPFHTDGTWVWYSDLGHYVEHHDSWLPADFVAVATESDPPELTVEQLTAIDEMLLGE
ncbi:hypothetical protein GCM10028864_69150 [Microlunatus parietis]